MMKKGKIALVIALISVAAVVVIGLIITVIYNVALKPADFENIIPVSGAGTGYYRYCYQELNEEEKAVYGVILQNIYNQPEKIEVPELANGDLTKVFKAISYDNPDLFNIGLKCKMYKKGFKNYFVPEYAIDYAPYQKQLKEATEIASAIIEETKNFTSTYEKEKYVHDYIINHCSYVEPEQSTNANTMYGCLVEGKASCEGYSRTFQYIMNKLDIDNRLVTGESADVFYKDTLTCLMAQDKEEVTFKLSEFQNILKVNNTFQLETSAQYDAYATALKNVKITVTVVETTVL